MAQALDMEFCACVIYTYGGFHSSALRLTKKLTSAIDPDTSVILPAEFKDQLKRQIAIAVQRGNADIMIQASQRHRQEALGKASYKQATRRQIEIHQHTQISAPIRRADIGELKVNNIEEHHVNTPTTTTTEQTTTDYQETLCVMQEKVVLLPGILHLFHP